MILSNAKSVRMSLPGLELLHVKMFNLRKLMVSTMLALIASLILPDMANARSARHFECNSTAIEGSFGLGRVPSSIHYHLSKKILSGPHNPWPRCSSECENTYRTHSMDYWQATRTLPKGSVLAF